MQCGLEATLAAYSSSLIAGTTYPPVNVIGVTLPYFEMSGTSQAAAVITGAVALMLQAEPSLTPDQVKCKLMSTARPAVETDGSLAYSVFQRPRRISIVSSGGSTGQRAIPGCQSFGPSDRNDSTECKVLAQHIRSFLGIRLVREKPKPQSVADPPLLTRPYLVGVVPM